jgi:hypothetical protein
MLVFVFNKQYYVFYDISTTAFNELLRTNSNLQQIWSKFCDINVFEATVSQLLENPEISEIYKSYLARKELAQINAVSNLFMADLNKITS